MSARFAIALIAISLLVLATACVPGITSRSTEPPPVTEDTTDPNSVIQTEDDDRAAAPSNPPSDNLTLPSISPKSTPGHTWAATMIVGNLVTISLPVAAMEDHVHFEVPANGGYARFLGYFVDGRFYGQATLCPNCGTDSVDWGAGVLKCGECDATFELISGEGRDGVPSYPSGRIAHATSGSTITMPLDALLVAHSRTASGEETLFEIVNVPGGGARGCCG